MNRFHREGTLSQLSLLMFIVVLFSSCSTVFNPMFEVTGLGIEKKENGYLIQLKTTKNVGDVTAFISRDDWLVITIVGGTVDFDRLRSTEPNELFSSVSIVGYKTSVQVTLKLKEGFKSCDVVRSKSDDDVAVALFTK